MTTCADTLAALPPDSPDLLRPIRVLLKETRYELARLLRTRAYSLSVIGFPVMFYLLFGTANRGHDVALYLIAGYACMGVVSACLFGVGLALAMERAQGWLDLKRASPMPRLAYLGAKVVSCAAFGLLIAIVLMLLGTALGGVSVTGRQAAALAGVVIAGSIPFTAMGFLIACLVPPNAGCFLALYLLLISVRSGTSRGVLLLALALLGAAYYPFNAGAGGMLIYVAAFAPFMTESLPLAGTMIAAAALITAAEGLLLHLSPWSWGVMSFMSASIGIGNLFGAVRMRANERLNLAQEQIEHLATIAERERIARDMHDVLGHTLSVVVLKSELAGKLIGNDAARARQEIGEVEQIARKALGEVREAIRGYRADGIAAEIGRARRALDAAGVRLEWQAEGVRLDPALESVLSLVLREAVTNILRHAGATSCRLELAADGRGTHFSLHDNGRGAIEKEGNGLRGMRERLEALGGRLEIDSRQGTRLTAEIPHVASA